MYGRKASSSAPREGGAVSDARPVPAPAVLPGAVHGAETSRPAGPGRDPL